MAGPVRLASSVEIAERRRAFAPETQSAFRTFSRQVFAAEMRAGGAYAYSTVALTAMAEAEHAHGAGS